HIMQFGHEQLDVCRVSLKYAVRESWAPYGDYDYDNDNDHECSRFQLIGFSVPCYPLKTRKVPLQRGESAKKPKG
ncbi:MAG: hypothetical protein JRK53_21455, partial [Deltaproteobacteria bacterium]|nr:hypothetical protein [Deltaproteobacteria bacterium]